MTFTQAPQWTPRMKLKQLKPAEVPADLPAEVVESEPPEDAEVLEASGGLGAK